MNADEMDDVNHPRTDIPRHKRWGGPLVMPENHRCQPGSRVCEKCGRSWKGKCPCTYLKRTTNFIDVVESKYDVQKWERRMVAYGMSQRPDLVLAATTCKPPHDKRNLTREDKAALQVIADEAKTVAKGDSAARIGTSLHQLTQRLDLGQELGYVPDPYPEDLRAYEDMVRREGIEYVDIESFRVHDEYRVGGTTDRMGWVRGRYCCLDIKTGDIWSGIGPAMQMAMYARSRKYDIATDTRVPDVTSVDLNIAYIIHLPQGTGTCRLIPVDIMKGWGACMVAKKVWDVRDTKGYILDLDSVRPSSIFENMAVRATNVTECHRLWQNAKDQGALTAQLKAALTARAEELKAAL